MRTQKISTMALAALLAACGGSDGGGPGADASADGSVDGGGEALCADGLAIWPFDATAGTAAYDTPAPDFTVQTTEGPFALSEAWTGCDNFVFVLYQPGYGAAADSFWASSVLALVEDSDPNTQYLFATLEADATPEEREARVRQIETRIEDALAIQDEEVQATWRPRFHYVLDCGLDVPVVAAVLAANPNEVHFAIDRHQLVREGNNTATYNGMSWVMQLGNTRYWARYYNAQYALDAALAAEEAAGDVLVTRVADRVEITAGEPFTWALPDAATMAQYQTLAIDMRVECPGAGHPYASTCGEWDTVGGIWLCADEACTAESQRRIVKWITPYSSPGRWVIDITPELVALAAGGPLRFVAAHGDNDVGAYTYKYTVDLRFGKSADGLRPFALEGLIPEGNYDFATMADAFDPFDVTPPAGTQKVELYARISGHGAVSPSQCAEFCTFEHAFGVNGVDYQHEYVTESTDGCAARVAEGVTPNQGGTWWYDRSSWCPGWVTEEWREDLTASFDLGGANAVEHVPTYQGGAPPGGNMDSRVELVFYR
jgi:hypothetical protein